MTGRRFHRTLITIEVLSEEPLGEVNILNLDGLAERMRDTDFSGRVVSQTATVLNGRQAVAALQDQASDPGFFGLDEEGNDIDGFDDSDENDDGEAEETKG